MEILEELFREVTGDRPENIIELSSSGSRRRYFRLSEGSRSFIGVSGTSADENSAFCMMSRHFASKGIPVPEVYAVSRDGMCYIQQDLGDTLLFDAVAQGREKGEYSARESALLCEAVSLLPKIQYEGAEGLDFSKCYPGQAMDDRTVMFDLNYFKYCFLKTAGPEFNELKLQADFERLCRDLLAENSDTFMYRDFQSRNVMVSGGNLYFIDFQGGMRGPVYYDLASFVWQARSRFPEDMKKMMTDTYISSLSAYRTVDKARFYERLRLFVLFRTMQVLGAYGFRGYFERKPHFLKSVPYALRSLKELLAVPFDDYPYLDSLLRELADSGRASSVTDTASPLVVTVQSFSYKKGMPEDPSGNGGGYVFDCRAIHNPGKYDKYKALTGMDGDVIRFLEQDGEVYPFLDKVYGLACAHVERYMERGFSSLMFCFGCTGGQHRSVYCAEHLASYIKERYNVKIRLVHREQEVDRWL